MQAVVCAQQSQEALPTNDAQGARQWIAAWRSKVLHVSEANLSAQEPSLMVACVCSLQVQS